MKKILVFQFLLFIGMTLSAQSFEGKILFEVSFLNLPDPQMASMFPNEAVSYFKNNKSRMEMSMMMGSRTVTISDGNTKSAVTLMDLMGQKYAIDNSSSKTSEEQKKMMDATTVTITNETKKIAGYTCKKAIIVILPTASNKDTLNMEMWFTNELSINKNFVASSMNKIDGAVLEFTIKQNKMDIKLSAKSVVKQSVEDSLFLIPADYKKTTSEEMMKSMGGH